MAEQFKTPRIVQPGGKSWIWIILLGTSLLGAVTWQAFDYGRQRAGYDVEKRDFQQVALQARVEKLEKERDELRFEAAKFERANQINQSAAIAVQDDIKILQNERAELKRKVEFLKSLVSGDITMLQIKDLALQKTEKGDTYKYAFSVSKRAKGRDKVRGTLVIAVSGQLKGEAHTLDMASLGIKAKRLAMGFSFYQKFEGEIVLPVGFIPKTLNVTVNPSDKKFKAFDEAFDWKVEVK